MQPAGSVSDGWLLFGLQAISGYSVHYILIYASCGPTINATELRV